MVEKAIVQKPLKVFFLPLDEEVPDELLCLLVFFDSGMLYLKRVLHPTSINFINIYGLLFSYKFFFTFCCSQDLPKLRQIMDNNAKVIILVLLLYFVQKCYAKLFCTFNLCFWLKNICKKLLVKC